MAGFSFSSQDPPRTALVTPVVGELRHGEMKGRFTISDVIRVECGKSRPGPKTQRTQLEPASWICVDSDGR